MHSLTAPLGLKSHRVCNFRSNVPASTQHCRVRLNVGRKTLKPVAALELDWSDPDTLVGAFACVAGIALGVGTLVWYGKVVERDEERLQTLRELNKATYESTGEYLSEVRALLPVRRCYCRCRLASAHMHVHGAGGNGADPNAKVDGQEVGAHAHGIPTTASR
jgi:hypothetical protein